MPIIERLIFSKEQLEQEYTDNGWEWKQDNEPITRQKMRMNSENEVRFGSFKYLFRILNKVLNKHIPDEVKDYEL